MDIFGIILLFAVVVICYKIYYDYQNKQNIKSEEDFIVQPANLQNSMYSKIKDSVLDDISHSTSNLVLNNLVEDKLDDLSDYINNSTGHKKNPKYLLKHSSKYTGKHLHKRSSKSMREDVEKYLDKMIDLNESNRKASIKTGQINPYFQEIQFHQDYRDTMNAFGLMCEGKNIFNKNYLPLLKSENPSESEVNGLANQFINALNLHVKNDVGDIAAQQLNSWNDNMPPIAQDNDILKKKQSWEQYNEELGLPPSIYANPAKREIVNLIKIDNIEKYETSAQLKYVLYLIIQKLNVEDQMIVKVSFVIDKSDINLEREFFDKNKNNFETKIIIEEISIIGFMIKEGIGRSKSQREKFYDYEGFSDGRMISEKDVIRQLNNKRKEIEENFICQERL